MNLKPCPVWRARYHRAADYALAVRFGRRVAARSNMDDGHAAHAATRLRMNAELRRLDDAAQETHARTLASK